MAGWSFSISLPLFTPHWDVTAHGDPRLRVLGAGELGEVIVDLLDEPHGEIVSDQGVCALRFFCSRPQGNEQGFLHR